MNISVNNLSKSFGKHKIFNDVSFEIKSGTMTCIYGPSGSGKTTLINILGMIEKFDSGCIYYDGKRISKRKDKLQYLAHKIGFVFQNFALIEDETVYENLKILKRFKNKECIKEVQSALKEFNLEGYENRKIYELSGGEQQRVALAKIYLKKCDVILADEPTASLDDVNKEKVISILRQFCNEGKTVVIVTHDTSLFPKCDFLIELKGGNV